MKREKTGRPRSKLKPATQLITRRVRRLVDMAHHGNVREAGQMSELPYATIRDLYSGRNVNPGIRTLERLASAYGFSTNWFTDASQPDSLPLGGLVVKVRITPPPRHPMKTRDLLIPFAAWPLPAVFRGLYAKLERLPPTPARPIIGTATELDAELLISEFLLAPLLAAERIGVEHAIYDIAMGYLGERDETDEQVTRLRALGVFWQEVLGDFLA